MMPSEDFSWLRLVLAFSVVMALLTALGYVLKYVSARGLTMPGTPPKTRRLQIVESVAADAKRRFVIVRCDGREHLLLLGVQGDIVIETNLPPNGPTS